MMVKTIFSGFGGQGVLMMGYSLAHGAMSAGYNVTFLPAYGAEVRGGTANCTVAVSDDEIASPIASEPDNIVVLNTPSLYTFQNRMAPGGAPFPELLDHRRRTLAARRPDLQDPLLGNGRKVGEPANGQHGDDGRFPENHRPRAARHLSAQHGDGDGKQEEIGHRDQPQGLCGRA